MFQDEARFGRMNEPKHCWAPPGIRPVVGHPLVREYTYAYAAVSPLDSLADFLILP
jgi:transposase